jgi:hypothetical protein
VTVKQMCLADANVLITRTVDRNGDAESKERCES